MPRLKDILKKFQETLVIELLLIVSLLLIMRWQHDYSLGISMVDSHPKSFSCLVFNDFPYSQHLPSVIRSTTSEVTRSADGISGRKLVYFATDIDPIDPGLKPWKPIES